MDLFAQQRVERVKLSPELIRIARMPRRVWAEEEVAHVVNELTDILKTPRGTMALRPLQAIALAEIGTVGGLLGVLSVGCGKCVAGDTEIFDATTGQRVSVAEVARFQIGRCKTIAMGEQGKLEEANCEVLLSGQKECVKLVLGDGSAVTLSEDHPVFTHRGWVQAGELVAEDFVATPRSVPYTGTPTNITDDEVILASYLLSDGAVSQRATSFTNACDAIVEEFCRVVNAIAEPSRNGKAGVTVITRPSQAFEIKCAGLLPFRDKWGIHGLAKEKRLPAVFWGLSVKQIGLFINRFWACDGWVIKTGPAMCLASEKMIDDLRFLLSRIGVQSRKSFRWANFQGTPFPAWNLVVRSHSAERFFEVVGPVLGKEKQCEDFLTAFRSVSRNTNVDVIPLGSRDIKGLLDEMGIQKWTSGGVRSEAAKFCSAKASQRLSREKFSVFCEKFNYRGRFAWLATSDLCWQRIAELTEVGPLPVYDLSVPSHGNFVGNNIVLHNTLVSLLAPVVLEAQRPLLLVPAKLVGKTERDRKILASHWRIPEFFRVMTYEWLGRAQAAAALDSYQPDLIVCDEAHRAKNIRGAAVAKRLRRYAVAHPKTKWVQLSGTVTKRSLHDYAHLLYWALKENSPLPDRWDDLETWADALDERKGQMRRADPGALEVLCNDDEKEIWSEEPRRAARLAYKRRLIETAGVVASYEADVDASLSVQSVEIDVKPATDDAFMTLRTKWETPDGWPISDGLTLSRHAFELALGFFYKWSPRPPQDWLEARRVWCAYVRKILKHSHKLDSSKQVALVSLEEPEYTEWKKLEDTFKPNTVPVWIDDSALKFCAEWAGKNRGIIWTKHTCFGERLEKDFGITYYGRKGLNSNGELIDNHKPGTPLIASIQSSGEGRNLQAWSTSLITAPPANGLQWEQLLGRLHRPGQEADEVSFDVLTTCVEHVQAFWQAYNDSRYVEQSVGSPQKLLVADISVPAPEDIALRREARWIKNQY